eukprot:SAG31_NODE_7345_length_1713_cov_1.925651_2_plen_87_part_00
MQPRGGSQTDHLHRAARITETSGGMHIMARVHEHTLEAVCAADTARSRARRHAVTLVLCCCQFQIVCNRMFAYFITIALKLFRIGT